MRSTRCHGIASGLAAAILFGICIPVAKLLLPDTGPVFTAALLYLGAGMGLLVISIARGSSRESPIQRSDVPWLAGMVMFGGILAPALMLIALERLSAVSTSLLLNVEAP